MLLGDLIMIKIKVISVRQAINSITTAFTLLILSVFVVFVFISSLYILKESLKTQVFAKSDNSLETFSRESLIKEIYENEFPAIQFNNIEENNNDERDNNINTELPTNEGYEEKNKKDIKVEVVEKHEYTLPASYEVELYESGKVRVGTAVITNYSKKNLDLNELSKPSDIKITKNSKFLIFHTHATESYTFSDNPGVVNYRTTDKLYNMVSVGNVLYNRLKTKGYECAHDMDLHDYPSYNGAYRSSLATVQEYMKKQKYDFVIDVHRDALSSNLGFRPTANINGETAAKLMFVVGTDACGLSHEEWMKNLKLALMIQNRADEMYPGLFREMNLSKSRYNQHISNGAFIIEVGATGNTLQEAQNAMKYLANVIDSFVD